jgi:hypothetical protein
MSPLAVGTYVKSFTRTEYSLPSAGAERWPERRAA